MIQLLKSLEGANHGAMTHTNTANTAMLAPASEEHSPARLQARLDALLAPFHALLCAQQQRQQARQARRALQAMDERELRDLGLGRSEIDYWT